MPFAQSLVGVSALMTCAIYSTYALLTVHCIRCIQVYAQTTLHITEKRKHTAPVHRNIKFIVPGRYVCKLIVCETTRVNVNFDTNVDTCTKNSYTRIRVTMKTFAIMIYTLAQLSPWTRVRQIVFLHETCPCRPVYKKHCTARHPSM